MWRTDRCTAALPSCRWGLTAAILLALAAPPVFPLDGREAPWPETTSASGRLVLVTLPQPPSHRLRRAGSSSRSYAGPRDYKATPAARRRARGIARDYGLRAVDEWPIELLGVHCVVFEVPPEQTTDDLLRRLAGDPRVDLAQPVNSFRVQGRAAREPPSPPYDDPYLELQRTAEDLQLEAAHRLATGRGVVVAIIDDGVDVTHPELSGGIAAAEDFVEEGTGFPTPEIHGTGVAGVIAAAAGNGLGIVGVAPAAELLALRACWQEAPGNAPARCNSFTLAKAIHYAVKRRPQVLNLSLTGPSDPLLARLLSQALDRGIVVIAALPEGEEGAGFPASLPGVIGVRAAAVLGAGPAAGAGSGGGLAAPGIDVLTTLPRASYDFLSGSSLAAAHVAGVAALLLEAAPGLSAREIRDLLAESSGPAPASSAEGAAPGINACAALALLASMRQGAGATASAPARCGDLAARSPHPAGRRSLPAG